jgi:hypothetical protein
MVYMNKTIRVQNTGAYSRQNSSNNNGGGSASTSSTYKELVTTGGGQSGEPFTIVGYREVTRDGEPTGKAYSYTTSQSVTPEQLEVERNQVENVQSRSVRVALQQRSLETEKSISMGKTPIAQPRAIEQVAESDAIRTAYAESRKPEIVQYLTEKIAFARGESTFEPEPYKYTKDEIQVIKPSNAEPVILFKRDIKVQPTVRSLKDTYIKDYSEQVAKEAGQSLKARYERFSPALNITRPNMISLGEVPQPVYEYGKVNIFRTKEGVQVFSNVQQVAPMYAWGDYEKVQKSLQPPRGLKTGVNNLSIVTSTPFFKKAVEVESKTGVGRAIVDTTPVIIEKGLQARKAALTYTGFIPLGEKIESLGKPSQERLDLIRNYKGIGALKSEAITTATSSLGWLVKNPDVILASAYVGSKAPAIAYALKGLYIGSAGYNILKAPNISRGLGRAAGYAGIYAGFKVGTKLLKADLTEGEKYASKILKLPKKTTTFETKIYKENLFTKPIRDPKMLKITKFKETTVAPSKESNVYILGERNPQAALTRLKGKGFEQTFYQDLNTGTTYSYTIKKGLFGRYFTAYGVAPEGQPATYSFYKNGKFLTTYQSPESSPLIGLGEAQMGFKAFTSKSRVVTPIRSTAYEKEVNVYTQNVINIGKNPYVIKGKGVVSTVGERFAEANRPFTSLRVEKPVFDAYGKISPSAGGKLTLDVKSPKIYFVNYAPQSKVDIVYYNKALFSATRNPTFLTKQLTDTNVFVKGTIYNPTKFDMTVRRGLAGVESFFGKVYSKSISGIQKSETVSMGYLQSKVNDAQFYYKSSYNKALLRGWKVQNLFKSEPFDPKKVSYSESMDNSFLRRVRLERYNTVELSAKNKEVVDAFKPFIDEDASFVNRAGLVQSFNKPSALSSNIISPGKSLSKTLVVPIVKSAPFDWQLNIPSVPVSSSKLSIVPINILKIEGSQVPKVYSKISSKSIVVPSISSVQSNILKPVVTPVVVPVVTPVSITRVNSVVSSSVVTPIITPIVTPVVTPVSVPMFKRVEVPPIIPPDVKPPKIESSNKSLGFGSKGFAVLVKRKGKYRPLRGIYTKEEALGLGSYNVARTLAASFKVVASEKPVTSRFSKAYFGQYRGILRGYKIRKGQAIPLQDEFIQRRGTRLGRSSEVAEIMSYKRAKMSKKAGFFGRTRPKKWAFT